MSLFGDVWNWWNNTPSNNNKESEENSGSFLGGWWGSSKNENPKAENEEDPYAPYYGDKCIKCSNCTEASSYNHYRCTHEKALKKIYDDPNIREYYKEFHKDIAESKLLCRREYYNK